MNSNMYNLRVLLCPGNNFLKYALFPNRFDLCQIPKINASFRGPNKRLKTQTRMHLLFAILAAIISIEFVFPLFRLLWSEIIFFLNQHTLYTAFHASFLSPDGQIHVTRGTQIMTFAHFSLAIVGLTFVFFRAFFFVSIVRANTHTLGAKVHGGIRMANDYWARLLAPRLYLKLTSQAVTGEYVLSVVCGRELNRLKTQRQLN